MGPAAYGGRRGSGSARGPLSGRRRGAARRVPGGTGGRGLGARTETEPRSEPSARTERAAEPALGPAAPHRSVEARKSPPVCL